MLKFLSVLCMFSLCVVVFCSQQDNYGSGLSVPDLLKARAAADQVSVTQPRDVNNFKLRVKRQHRGRQPPRFGSSQSSANAAANNNFFGQNGFGASAANAQAQGFQSQGPLGGFGASAANTQTQSFTANRNGIQGSAGASASQVYRLPNGHTLNVAFADGFSVGPNGITGSNSNGVTYN